jgi:thiosulfate dehydrogenase
MKRIFFLYFLLMAAATAAIAGMEHGAHDITPIEYSQESFNEEMRISRGGQLYDNWWKTTLETHKPEGDHLLWKTQSTNKRSGYSTYRCKECHGWDYQGKDGAYGKGSHFTGFSGVYEAAKKMSIEELEAVLKGSSNKDHDFSGILSSADIPDLALFLKKGVIDLAMFINADGSLTGGNPEAGNSFFQKSCAHMCHGPDGTMINFGDEEKPEFVSTVANKNPWEFIHKVRAGQPGTRMPSGIMNKWKSSDILDVLAYSQTLPKDIPEAGWFTRMMRSLGMGKHDWFIPEDSRGFGPAME